MKVANGYFHIAGMTGSWPEGEHPGDDMYTQAKSIFQKKIAQQWPKAQLQ